MSTFEHTIGRPGLRRWCQFFLALLIGATLFLSTNNAIAGAVVPSLVAGWPSFSTGLWLLQADQSRPRAQIGFAFYLSTACWKGAAAALVSVIIFGFVAKATGNDPTVEQIAATMLTMLAAIILNTLIGLGATCAAVIHRIKVWIHPKLRAQLEGNLVAVARGNVTRRRINHAIFVVATSLVFPVIALACGLLTLLAVETPNDVDVGSVVIVLVIVFGAPISMIPVYGWVSSRVIAQNPLEYWATDSNNGVQDGIAAELAARDAFGVGPRAADQSNQPNN